MTTSAFWFYARLRPAAATSFDVFEVPIARGVRFEAYYDGIAVWCKPSPDAIATPEEAREFFGYVVSAYALISGVALDASFEGWIEATEASFKGTMVGFGIDPRIATGVSRRSRRSVDMRRAARLAAAVRHRPGWRLAASDVASALRSPGDDSFVFAFRAVEDVARAVSGRTGQLTASDWASLHNLLGVTATSFRKRIEPLQRARRAAAHGDETDQQLVTARGNRKRIIEIARHIVADAIVREPHLPLERAHVRR